MDRVVPVVIDRPLRLGEVFAQAINLYGAVTPAALLVGALQAGSFLLAFVVPWYVQLVALSLAFVLSFAIIVRLVAGDGLSGAARETMRKLPLLLPLAVVTAAPFYAGLFFLEFVFLILSVAWLGLTAFAIPVAMLEPSHEGRPARGLWRGLRQTLRRMLALASANYLHAIGVALALVLVYLLLGNLLVRLLFSFADQGEIAAPALVQVVLAPFFFLGLTVLYLEQSVRLAGRHAAPRQR